MSTTTYGSTAEVAVGGAVLPTEVDRYLVSVTVDLAAGLPAVAVLRWSDPEHDVLTKAGVAIGKPVTIKANYINKPALLPLFAGEVTAIEYEYDATGTTASVRCTDKLHRLTRGRRTRSWVQATDASVARAVIGGAGLAAGTIEGSTALHDHVAQLGCTDWEFLTGRARATGHEVVLDEGKVHVRKPAPAGRGPGFTLAIGEDLTSLRVRITAAGQVSTVTTGGWDPKQARKVSGQARTPAGTGPSQQAASRIAGPFTPQPLHEGSALVTTQAEATARAQAVAARVADGHVELEGWAAGHPGLQPGVPVTLEGVSKDIAGTYVLSRTEHVIDGDGYRTRFEVGGEGSLRGLAGGPSSSGNPQVPGVTVGVVTDIKDPLKQGRVKVKFPWLSDEYATDWVRLVSPGGGKEHGLVVVPEVNDEVLVAFAHGDTRLPYVLGGLWSGRAAPPLGARLVDAASGRVSTRTLMSRDGHRLTVSDQPGRGGIEIATGDAKMNVTLATAMTKITVSSKGDVLVEGTGQVTVKATSKLTLESVGQLEIKGAMVKIQATGPVDIQGAVIKLN